MSQSVRNIFRDSRENIAPYYSQNIWLKSIHYTYDISQQSQHTDRLHSLQEEFQEGSE